MSYEIILTQETQDFLNKCDRSIRDQIVKKFEHLKNNPELGKPLTANLAGLWSLRIGDYRAIYEVKHNQLIIVIIRIGHRKDVYSR
jgi:mRNA interferase RelE/StbE